MASARLKVLLSFGRPESGQNLLALAAHLLGKRVADAAIVAVHYTVGTDLNPVKAGQYARNSFKPLNREARRLNLQVDLFPKIRSNNFSKGVVINVVVNAININMTNTSGGNTPISYPIFKATSSISPR